MNLTLHVWRQKHAHDHGSFVQYEARAVSPDMSFLEMLDVVNEGLIGRGEDPIAFDHDCREGICGTCGMVINGAAHGPRRATTACQLHMRSFKDGDTITIEPWRAAAFPVIKDLVVDRSAFDRIIAAGGFISVPQGQPERYPRVRRMVAQMDAEGFGTCTNHFECEAVCPKSIGVEFIARLNRDYIRASLTSEPRTTSTGGEA